jgi:KR domain-containing protein
VHLWGLDTPAATAGGGLDPDAAALPSASLLLLVQALSTTPAGGVPRLLVASRGCQPAAPGGTGVPHPLGAVMWGLLKSVPIENALLPLRCVDLDPAGGELVEPLLAEMAVDSPDVEVAYRQGRRLVRRLAEVPAASPPLRRDRLALREDATYLVTGGTGGLGLRVAGLLVERGARRVVLVARRADRPGAAQALDRVHHRRRGIG